MNEFFKYLSAIAAILTIIGTIYQLLVPQEVKLVPADDVQFESKQISEKNREPKDDIKEKQAKLKNDLILANKTDPKSTLKNVEDDNWPITVLKTWIVFFALILSLILSFFTLIVDLIFSPTDESFGLTTDIWNYSWNTILIDWCGKHSSPNGVIVGVISLIIYLNMVFDDFGKYRIRSNGETVRGLIGFVVIMLIINLFL